VDVLQLGVVVQEEGEPLVRVGVRVRVRVRVRVSCSLASSCREKVSHWHEMPS